MVWLALILCLPYFVTLLIIRRHLDAIHRFEPEGDGNGNIFVSVIIACKNEEATLPRILHDLTIQDYPAGSFEVLVTDDNSEDNTIKTARSFIGSLNLKVLKNSGSGKKSAIRTAIYEAKGNLILTTDADCSANSGWISTIVSFYRLNKPHLIICPVMFEEGNGFFGRFQELEFLSLQGITAATAMAGNATMCNGANLAFTHESYLSNEKNLRFDIPTGDDVFLLHSMKKKGEKILWLESASATVVTKAANGLIPFLKQRKRWASKSTAYRDRFSIFLGIATLLINLIQAVLLTGAIIEPRLLPLFIAVFIIKSIPDFLILLNTTKRYEKTTLMRWFLPSQIIYPFYVLIVTLFAISSPSRKGI